MKEEADRTPRQLDGLPWGPTTAWGRRRTKGNELGLLGFGAWPFEVTIV